jgi:hypothetical protein
VLNTTVSILAAVALLLPGFIVVEIARSGRARAGESDLEIALRALFFALVIHTAFSWWTRLLVQRIHDLDAWPAHVDALVLYSVVVLLLVPVALGVVLNRYLRKVEASQGRLKLHQRVLGGGDVRDAWDYVFQRLAGPGGWLIVELRGSDSKTLRLVGGKCGDQSSVGQSPSEHNLYLQELWTVGTTFPHNLVEKIEPQRGMWIACDAIVRIEVLNPPGVALH